MALLRIRKPDGEIVEIACLPGAKGEDGKTPVKGVDYFTEEEVAEVVADCVKKDDFATSSTAGVVKCGDGLTMTSSGKLVTSFATRDNIDLKTASYKCITPKFLDYAVKVGLTTNTEVLTDEEKAAVQEWLGVTERLGDVEAALDELRVYVQSLVSGGAVE